LLPAFINADGTMLWSQNGEPHNDSRDENGRLLPASTYANGTMIWYKKGKLHNEDRDENYIFATKCYLRGLFKRLVAKFKAL
jgi:hypothetical protein